MQPGIKILPFLVCITVISCCSNGKTAGKNNDPLKTDSSIAVVTNELNYEANKDLPGCIKTLISTFRKEEKQNPPRSVYSYSYNGKTVYYLPAICCDFFSDLYDKDCTLIAHPDGGFTGRGDGRASDFVTSRTEEKLIWKDER